jgi:hypothetical protein
METNEIIAVSAFIIVWITFLVFFIKYLAELLFTNAHKVMKNPTPPTVYKDSVKTVLKSTTKNIQKK